VQIAARSRVNKINPVTEQRSGLQKCSIREDKEEVVMAPQAGLALRVGIPEIRHIHAIQVKQ
jgi:hypothetical protein